MSVISLFLIALQLIALAPSSAAPFLRWHWFVDEDRVAIGGYDPVAYHTQGQAVRGDPEHVAEHEGVVYHFTNSEHAAVFRADTEPFLPAYGGWCAYAMGQDSERTRFAQVRYPPDPELFLIDDGRLMLFSQGAGWNGRQLWMQGDLEAFTRRADRFWESREALSSRVGEKPAGLHPHAPLETTQFDFFIGVWDSDYELRTSPESDATVRLHGRWTARYGWNGFAVYDDWIQLDAPPNASGPAIRSYDPLNRQWVMHYIPINAPATSVWRMTGEFDDEGALHGELELRDAQGRTCLQRIHFRDITENHFTWSCDRSYDGGETWLVDWGVGSNTRLE